MHLLAQLSRRASVPAALRPPRSRISLSPFAHAMAPSPAAQRLPSTRPKRAASSSPSKPSAAAAAAEKSKGGAADAAGGVKRTKLNNGIAAKASRKDDEEEDLLLLEDDALDSELLMEVAEQAEREAATKLERVKVGNGSARTIAPRPAQGAAAAAAAKKKTETAVAKPASVAPSAAAAGVLHKDSDDEVHTMEAEWRAKLQGELKKEYFIKLKQFIASERKAGKIIYPPTHLVHNWSRLTPLRRVKVVVVGQDPYHGTGQACGHSFSVPKGVAVPGSLQNIYKELKNEYPDFVHPKHGCLDEWAKQGVLLLNACLTVYAGQAGSHHGKGWETFTRVILKTIADEAANGGGGSSAAGGGLSKAANKSAANPFGWSTVGTSKSIAASGGKAPDAPTSSAPESAASTGSERCKGVVFLVWGQPAAKTVAAAGVTDKSPNVLILRSPHPSPLSAHRGFLGNGHFKKANEWLERIYGPGGGIDWAKL